MGAENSKENNRSNTPENKRQYPRQRQNVYGEATTSPAYHNHYESPPQAPTYYANHQFPPQAPTYYASHQTPPQAPTYHTNHQSPPQAPTYYANQQPQPQAPTYNTNHQSPPQTPTSHANQSPHQTPTSHANNQSPPRAPTLHTNQQSPSQVPIERDRKPYSYTTADLQKAVKQSNPQPTLERSRQPYNFSTDELPNGAKLEKPQNVLYPNLNRSEEDFVHVNFYGEQRSNPLQPSAPPASQVLNTGKTRPAQPFVSGAKAPGTSKSDHSSANNNKTRPAARNRNNQVTCPTCDQRLGLTIFQCSGGHSCCKECRLANRSCGTCRSPITDMRNIMLEACIAEMKSPCQNQGCTLSFNEDDMNRHMKECPFGEIDCPMGTYFGQCTTRCKVTDLAAHFDVYHKEQRTAEIDKEMYVFNVCMEAHKIYLIKNGPFTFLVHVKVGEKDRKISLTVQLFGTKMSAVKWTYEIHVYNKRQPLRKYLYVDNCQPISTAVDDIIKEDQCATLPLPYAMTFVNESALTYKFYIKREANQRARRGGPRSNHPN